MIDSLHKAQDATKKLEEESSEFQWIKDKMEEEFGIWQFEGELPDHMIRSLVSDIVELGFQRNERSPGTYKYYLYDENGEYSLLVKSDNRGNQTVRLRYEECELA